MIIRIDLNNGWSVYELCVNDKNNNEIKCDNGWWIRMNLCKIVRCDDGQKRWGNGLEDTCSGFQSNVL